MNKQRFFVIFLAAVIFIIALLLLSCREEGQVVSKPDEYTRGFEASENTILRVMMYVLRENGFGNAKIDSEQNRVESDYITQSGWRSKCIACVKKINWNECDVTLSVITEKKTSTGWEMRRLLEKEQYDSIFDAIDLQIYREMYKVK